MIAIRYGCIICGEGEVSNILNVAFEFPYSEDAYCTATYPENRP
jgi:hypothetical protein